MSANTFKIHRLGMLLVVLATAGISRGQSVTVRFNPAFSIQEVSEVFTVDLVADISDPVVGWGLDFAIATPGVVSMSAAPAINSAHWFAASSSDGDGLAGLAFPSGVSGTGIVLATLTFSADALGETDLLAAMTGGDLTEGFALDPAGFAEVTFEPGHVLVVPEPAALLMLALGGLPILRRR